VSRWKFFLSEAPLSFSLLPIQTARYIWYLHFRVAAMGHEVAAGAVTFFWYISYFLVISELALSFSACATSTISLLDVAGRLHLKYTLAKETC
jgi:hypothetical protein